MEFFTSDLHLQHKKIIEYDKRPFASVEEMDATLLSNWNKRVGNKDTVYIVGDFCLSHNRQLVEDYLLSLNGRKVMVWGNHDDNVRKLHKQKPIFDEVYDLHYLRINRNKERHRIMLCHYPMLSWRKSNHNSILVHGHNHHIRQPVEHINSVNVCVSHWDYFPVSLDEIYTYINSRKDRDRLDGKQISATD